MQQNNNHKSYQLPENATVAMYVRQTTHQQYIAGRSTNTRQADLLRAAISRMGVPDDHIIDIHDAPASTENPRTGMQILIDHILQGDIQAVFVSQERSLCSDKHIVSATTFLELCQERNILICTPYTAYDVSHPYDAHRFRSQAEDAHIYIQQYVRSRLHSAKEQAAQQGYYDGRPLPPGYIVNRQGHSTEDANATYKKIIPYEPHAAIIRSIFQQYVESCGRANELYTMLQKILVLFPEFDEAVDQRATLRTTLKKIPGGYHLTFASLKHMLAGNEVYIGTWIYKDKKLPHNHPGIVPEELFWQAKELFSRKHPDTNNLEEQ